MTQVIFSQGFARQADRDDRSRRDGHSHALAGQGHVVGTDGLFIVRDPSLSFVRRKPSDAELGALGAAARVGEDGSHGAVDVLEGSPGDARERARGCQPPGARTHEARPHGKSPETTAGDDLCAVAGDEVRGGLELVHLDALPVDVGAEAGVDDGGGELAGPGQALALAAAGEPGGAPARLQVAGLGDPGREPVGVELAGGLAAVRVRRDDAHVLVRAGAEQLRSHARLRAPAHGVAAREDGLVAEVAAGDGVVQSGKKRSGFTAIGSHRRVTRPEGGQFQISAKGPIHIISLIHSPRVTHV